MIEKARSEIANSESDFVKAFRFGIAWSTGVTVGEVIFTVVGGYISLREDRDSRYVRYLYGSEKDEKRGDNEI